MGYERLGEAEARRWSTCVAQSVGFMGPVFSAAFIIPLIVGANAAARGRGRRRAARGAARRRSACSRSGWIVAQYAKRIHAAGSLYDYVSNGLGSTLGAASGWLYYGGTIILTTGLGVLIGGYVHDNLLPDRVRRSTRELLPIWAVGRDLRAAGSSWSCTSACRSRRACS